MNISVVNKQSNFKLLLRWVLILMPKPSSNKSLVGNDAIKKTSGKNQTQSKNICTKFDIIASNCVKTIYIKQWHLKSFNSKISSQLLSTDINSNRITKHNFGENGIIGSRQLIFETISCIPLYWPRGMRLIKTNDDKTVSYRIRRCLWEC